MHVHFTYVPENRHVRAETRVGEAWQGFKGIVHGGILAGLLDDAMWHALWHETHVMTMTADLRVRYHKPARIGIPLTIVGTLREANRRMAKAEARIEQQNITVATSEAVFLPARELHE
jgi:uncharacterized protein (TIGR00369 family)